MTHRDISDDQARSVLQILKDECGYIDSYNGEGFVRSIRWPNGEDGHPCREYRFIGKLGFGGKFRNNGNYDNTPYIDCYQEHATPERRAMMERANARLAELFNSIK